MHKRVRNRPFSFQCVLSQDNEKGANDDRSALKFHSCVSSVWGKKSSVIGKKNLRSSQPVAIYGRKHFGLESLHLAWELWLGNSLWRQPFDTFAQGRSWILKAVGGLYRLYISFNEQCDNNQLNKTRHPWGIPVHFTKCGLQTSCV